MPITIFIVDDEEIVRKLVRVALKGLVDAIFLEANNAAEALKVAREHGGPIDLLVSDVAMPGRMNGAEMAALLSQTRPDTKVVLMSGYPPDTVTIKADWLFVEKPFAAAKIREKIGSLLAEHCVAAS